MAPRLDRSVIGCARMGLACLVVFVAATFAGCSFPLWPTYRRDAARSGVDPDSTSPVAPTQLWQTAPALDGDIWGQPLVYGSRVYAATENDTLYALDAATGQVVWHSSAGTAVPASQLPCGDISPVVGITGTPVIDPATQRIYAVADTWDGSNPSTIHHRLVGFNLSDGSPAPGLPLVVDPPGNPPADQLQRPALALDGSEIVIGYGGNDGDCGSYRGWLVAAPESGSGTVFNFEVEEPGNGGAIWGAGNGPAVDSAGDIWAATGNGFSGSTYAYQESVLKLDMSLRLLDHWAPSNWQALDGSDLDLGSSEPVLLPNGLVFQIGKQGTGYLLAASSLGGTGAKPLFGAQVCGGSFGGGVYFGGVIYVACADGLHALSLSTSTSSFAALPGWNVNSSAIGPPIVAGGLVWSAGWGNGVLYGLNPASGTTTFSASLGRFDHFASPSAAGGRLFVANGDRVTAFTIATAPAATPAGAPAPAQVVTSPTTIATRPADATSALLSRLKLSVSRTTLTLKMTLSEPATVTVSITQTIRGKWVKHRCRAHERKGRACSLTARKASLTLKAVGGPNRFMLRLSALRPGHYAATISARDAAGRRSMRYTLAFTIKRPSKLRK